MNAAPGESASATALSITVEDVRARAPAWGLDCYRDLSRTLQSTDPAFPCTFAVGALARQHLRYYFAESPLEAASLSGVRDALLEYMGNFREIGGRYTSLVIFFRPESDPLPLDEYRRRFWNVLQYLHDRDPKPWPEGIPRTPDHPRWQFCCGGEDIFVVCNNPAHSGRLSRKSDGMTIFLQPMWTFEHLLASEQRMLQACRPIRARLEEYDQMGRHPALGMLGETSNREWQHYFLPDTNTDSYGQCPLKTDPV
ncbi:MAG TPA: YqcI/YcgG family protein [Solirubrobacteraceae bacterium]|nr:YqcI/YcgG family protein [Solirubrobacteraceae bacterium]